MNTFSYYAYSCTFSLWIFKPIQEVLSPRVLLRRSYSIPRLLGKVNPGFGVLLPPLRTRSKGPACHLTFNSSQLRIPGLVIQCHLSSLV